MADGRDHREPVHPTRDDGVVRSLSEVVGGPVGTRAGRGRPFTTLGVLLALTALTFAIGLATKGACAADGWQRDGGPGSTPYTHLCVSTVPDSYTGTALVERAWPWSSDLGTRERYAVTTDPVLVAGWQYAAAWVTQAVTGLPDLGLRYQSSVETLAGSDEVATERAVYAAVNAVGLALLALLTTAALVGARRRRRWDAAVLAVAPMLALAGFVSYDLLPVTAVAGALWAWSRERPGLAGVLVGAGAAAGVWPALLLVAFALVTAWRPAAGGSPDGPRSDRIDLLLPAVVGALGAFVLLSAPAFVSGREQWRQAWVTAVGRGPDQGSLWAVLDQSVGIPDDAATGLALALLGLWTAGVAVLALTARERPRVSQVALLLVAGPLVVGVAWEPPQALWLLPPAALARPRWRDLLVWQACEAVAFAMTWWWQGGLLEPGSGGGAGFYWLSVLVRVAGVLWLVAVVARDVRLPSYDVVRRDEAGDPGDTVAGEAQPTTTRSTRVVV